MKICPRCSEILQDDATRCPKDGTALRPVLDPLIGKTIGGRYRLISRIGAGGMSSVYLARHVMIDRLMAIKTLRRDLAQDPVQRDRFIREARAVNRINHENIVEITDFGETDDGLVYLVMEYVPGEPLLRVLQHGPMESGRALHIIRQCASALSRAHQMGVVHRDLKPENVLLVPRKDRPDFVKILDFGIAKILDAPSLTGSQQIFGTPGYIAPEYIQSTDIDGRADLYSLGVILYELVTGALPFDYEYPGDLLVKHVTEPPVAPSVRYDAVDKPVEELILRCLEKDPQDRFRDAFHFIEELDAVRERIGSADAWGAMSEDAPATGLRDTLVTPEPAPGLGSRALDTLDAVELDPELLETQKRLPESTPARARANEAAKRLRPRATVEYARPSIPEPPAMESVSLPDAAAAVASVETGEPDVDAGREENPTPQPTPFEPERDGLLGVRRWRNRYDAICAYLNELSTDKTPPDGVSTAIARATDSLAELEERASRVAAQQAEVERLNAEARTFRAELGAQIDEVAGRLSHERGQFEKLASARNSLRAARDGIQYKVKQGSASIETVETKLRELAAVEAELRDRGVACDDLEVKLADLRAQLDDKNERAERELEGLVAQLDRDMVRLEHLAAQLRPPLEDAEQYVLAHWSAGEDDQRSPTPVES